LLPPQRGVVSQHSLAVHVSPAHAVGNELFKAVFAAQSLAWHDGYCVQHSGCVHDAPSHGPVSVLRYQPAPHEKALQDSLASQHSASLQVAVLQGPL
jgi:hypothetical protein